MKSPYGLGFDPIKASGLLRNHFIVYNLVNRFQHSCTVLLLFWALVNWNRSTNFAKLSKKFKLIISSHPFGLKQKVDKKMPTWSIGQIYENSEAQGIKGQYPRNIASTTSIETHLMNMNNSNLIINQERAKKFLKRRKTKPTNQIYWF